MKENKAETISVNNEHAVFFSNTDHLKKYFAPTMTMYSLEVKQKCQNLHMLKKKDSRMQKYRSHIYCLIITIKFRKTAARSTNMRMTLVAEHHCFSSYHHTIRQTAPREMTDIQKMSNDTPPNIKHNKSVHSFLHVDKIFTISSCNPDKYNNPLICFFYINK